MLLEFVLFQIADAIDFNIQRNAAVAGFAQANTATSTPEETKALIEHSIVQAVGYSLAGLNFSKVKKAIEKEVVSSYYDFLINQEKFFITKELLKTATENAKVTLGMYKNGKISILELLNVHSKLEEAKLNYVESKYSWFTYRAKLLNAIGKLDLNNVINIGEF